jgi:hypothetical protein
MSSPTVTGVSVTEEIPRFQCTRDNTAGSRASTSAAGRLQVEAIPAGILSRCQTARPNAVQPSLSHQTESFDKLDKAFGLAKGTPLSDRMAVGSPSSAKSCSKHQRSRRGPNESCRRPMFLASSSLRQCFAERASAAISWSCSRTVSPDAVVHMLCLSFWSQLSCSWLYDCRWHNWHIRHFGRWRAGSTWSQHRTSSGRSARSCRAKVELRSFSCRRMQGKTSQDRHHRSEGAATRG